MTFLRLINNPRILLLIVFGVLLIPTCKGFKPFDYFDVHIKNCAMDNIRIIGPGTNLHLERDEECRDISLEYLASLDLEVRRKVFSLERSVGGCQALLEIKLTSDAIDSIDSSDEKLDVCLRDIDITLQEISRGEFRTICSQLNCLDVNILDCPE